MSLALPPRSVRNSNPGNLRKGITWDGLSQIQSDPEFCVFQSPVMGFRALAIDLHTKWFADGLETISMIIGKYAPPPENDTKAYIKAVCDGMGRDQLDWLNLNDADQLGQLCRAIATHEAGGWMFSPADLSEGVRLALQSVNANAKATA